MWAPSKSFARDDDRDLEVEDEPDTELVSFSAEIAAGDTHRFQYQPQKPERLRFLWASPSCAENFVLGGFRLGVIAVLGETRAPALVFARGRGFPFPSTDATMLPGIIFSFEAVNASPCRRVFTAVLRVRTFDRDAIGFTSDGRAVRGASPVGLPPGTTAPAWMRAAWGGRR